MIENILCLNPFYCYLMISRQLFVIERSMMKDLNVQVVEWKGSLSLYNSIQIISIILYWIFIWYFDQIYPGLFSQFKSKMRKVSFR